MHANAEPNRPSGCAEFDEARSLLAAARSEEALDLFEVASGAAADAAVRVSAGAFAAGILLASGRPWEVAAWADFVRASGGSRDLADLLEAAALLQFEDTRGALALLEGVDDPSDPWFPCSRTVARVVRSHARYVLGDEETARAEIMQVFAEDSFSPDVWDAFARLCAETDFDPAAVVAHVPPERTLEVLAALQNSEARGVARIAELIWQRDPGDARVLALVPSFAARLDSVRALEWSARMRVAGMGRTCPLLARADDVSVEVAERVRAAALAHASFGDTRARESLELAIGCVADDDLGDVLAEVWTIAPALADSVVVAGAITSRRALVIAGGLHDGGAASEAYAVLVHGLSLPDADHLTTDDVVALLPIRAMEALARIADARGEEDVADVMKAVAVVASARR